MVVYEFAYQRYPSWSATEDDSGVMTGLGVLSGCTLAAFKDRANWNDDDGIPG